jgi:propane monooxygenase coupling protein
VTSSLKGKVPSRFDNEAHTSSNMCGFTLQPSQTGSAIAEVMDRKDNVTVTHLPAMIRVDATDRISVEFDEVAEALGEEPESFGHGDLEEVISTHYGRMVNEDDRALFFANPEDAAEYIGFDLQSA